MNSVVVTKKSFEFYNYMHRNESRGFGLSLQYLAYLVFRSNILEYSADFSERQRFYKRNNTTFNSEKTSRCQLRVTPPQDTLRSDVFMHVKRHCNS